MPDEFSASDAESEHRVLEEDMKRLAAEVRAHRERPESRNLSEREIVRQSLERLLPPVRVRPQSDAGAPSASQGPLPAYAETASPETKLEIEYLLEVAFHKGLEKAEAEAQKSTPFVLDAFHDALAGKLYTELERAGLLK